MIKNSDLEQAVRDHSSIALHLIKVLTQKLLNAQVKIRTLAFSDTYMRTGQILVKLAKQYGQETPKGIKIDLAITRQELANLVGTSRETVTRVLSELKRQKIIDLAERKITVLKLDQLENLL